MPGVGLLVGQDVPQGGGRCKGGGREINGGPEQPEQAGRGQPAFHQINGIFARLRRIRRPNLAELLPKQQIGEQQPAGHHGYAAVPDGPQKVRQIDLVFVRCLVDDIKAVKGNLNVILRGRAYRHAGSIDSLHNKHLVRTRERVLGRSDIEGLHILHDRFRSGQNVFADSGQIYGNQKPQQYQPPEGVLKTAGDFRLKQPPQEQQREDQNRRSKENFFHVCPPPACSRIAESSARSVSES